MTGLRPPACWICSDRECGGWLCSSGGMPILTPAQLRALAGPRLCVVCEARPALVGKLSNFCEVCNPEAKEQFRRKLPEEEEDEREMEDARQFEHDHGWGAGHNRFGDNVWRGHE